MTLTLLLLGSLLSLSTLIDSVVPDTVIADHYRVYRADGTPASLDDISEAMQGIDVLFIGENHNDPVAHRLQLELLIRAFQLQFRGGSKASLSMEMFARDAQDKVDEYLTDLITERAFLASSQPWDNYDTDYKPLVEFAKEHKLSVIAANAPRRYSNRVTRLGRESLHALSDQAQTYLAPLPYGSASEKYRDQWEKVMAEDMEEMRAAMEEKADSTGGDGEDGMPLMGAMNQDEGDEKADDVGAEMSPHDKAVMKVRHEGAMKEHGEMAEMSPHDKAVMKVRHEGAMKEHGEMAEKKEHGADEDSDEDEGEAPAGMAAAADSVMHGGDNMLDSQSLWDATMAYSIAEYQTRNPGTLTVHVVGGFHVETGTGIPEHLIMYRPATKSLVVMVVPAEDISSFDPEEHTDLGDFVILSDESLSRTSEELD